jgi:hypothetical protein
VPLNPNNFKVYFPEGRVSISNTLIPHPSTSHSAQIDLSQSNPSISIIKEQQILIRENLKNYHSTPSNPSIFDLIRNDIYSSIDTPSAPLPGGVPTTNQEDAALDISQEITITDASNDIIINSIPSEALEVLPQAVETLTQILT